VFPEENTFKSLPTKERLANQNDGSLFTSLEEGLGNIGLLNSFQKQIVTIDEQLCSQPQVQGKLIYLQVSYCSSAKFCFF